MRPQSRSAKLGAVRTVRLHPQEALLHEELSLRQNPACGEYLQRRVVPEHRLARLVQLGIRQARYFGSAKTRFQLYLAATVANLTLLAGISGLDGGPGPEFNISTIRANPDANRSALQRRSLLWATVCLAAAWPLLTSQRTQGFPLNFYE